MSSRPATTTRRPPAARPRPRPRPRRAPERHTVFLLVPVAILVVIGLGAVWSASSVVAIRDGLDQHAIFQKQLAFVAAGALALFAAMKVPYDLYRKWAPGLLVISIIGLVATAMFGSTRGGAERWIEVGPITIQASEFSKFAVVAFLSATLTRKEKHLRSFTHLVVPVAVSLGLTSVLLLEQPDLGTTLLIGGSALAVLVASAARFSHVATLGIGSLGLAILFAFSAPYRRARMFAFLDPNPDPLGDGLQTFQSLVALGTGGLFGVGLGASRARWSFLPNAHTDFIFAIIGEEQGLAGALVVVALFVMFAVVGTGIALRAKDQFGRLLAIGIVTWISLQAIVNIGGVVKALPVTGVPLPFVSAGGSAMLVSLAAIGVLVNIARTGKPPRKSSR